MNREQLTVIYDSAYRFARKERKMSVKDSELYAENAVNEARNESKDGKD